MNNTNTTELTDEQVNLLLAARDIHEDGGDPVVIADETLEQIKTVMGNALRETTGLPSPEALEIDQMAAQLKADHDEAVDALVQRPETERPNADDLDAGPEKSTDGDPTERYEQADTQTQQDIRTMLARAQAIESRTPKHADSLRRDCAQSLGVSVDALDELEKSIPSDPRLI